MSTDNSEKIIDEPFDKALSERYLSYALATIMSRSLPDVRDGLKPVHRRLLYAMRLLKLDPGTGFKKCARVVGDVIGRFHPHGDQAVYDALVRLAQGFAVRYPLVEGQGNFGNVDGDNPAAMRYTEARLTALANALMEGLDQNAVDFRQTYDGEDEEPVVLPAAYPNLLANGASGIAVGMATSIPPHNLPELIAGLRLLIETRLGKRGPVTSAELVEHIAGPDFPTGGLIIEPREAIIQAYETGRGGFRLRARWHSEDAGRGTWRVVISEIPYQVQKSKLIERIADLINERKLPLLSDIRDESDADIRIVIEPRSRSVDPELLMEGLFKLTELETRFPLNLNVIDLDGAPRVLSLGAALDAYLDHRIEVLKRRTRHRLDQIARRLEVLGGYLIAYLNLDEVISIIRESDEPKPALTAAFDLSETQAEAILNMRLRALRKLEEIEIRKEHEALEAEQATLDALMESPARQWRRIDKDLVALLKDFGPESPLGKRRTGFGDAPDVKAIPLEAMVDREPVTVICSRRGWLRAVKGHVAPGESFKFKEGDEQRFRFHSYTTDKIFAFTNRGRMLTLAADKLPGGRGHGEPLSLMVDLAEGEEVIALFPHQAEGRLLLAGSLGRGFIAEADKCVAMTRNGKQLLNLSGEARASHCLAIPAGHDHVALIGTNRKLLIFALDELPVMARGQGVILQKYKQAQLSDIVTFARAEGLSWEMGGASGRWRTIEDITEWLGRRGNVGRLPPSGFPRNNRFR